MILSVEGAIVLANRPYQRTAIPEDKTFPQAQPCKNDFLFFIIQDDFGNENFLNKPVDKPRIHEGSGEIRKISDAKAVDSKHDTRELDTLLREIYDKFVTVDSGDGMYPYFL